MKSILSITCTVFIGIFASGAFSQETKAPVPPKPPVPEGAAASAKPAQQGGPATRPAAKGYPAPAKNARPAPGSSQARPTAVKPAEASNAQPTAAKPAEPGAAEAAANAAANAKKNAAQVKKISDTVYEINGVTYTFEKYRTPNFLPDGGKLYGKLAAPLKTVIGGNEINIAAADILFHENGNIRHCSMNKNITATIGKNTLTVIGDPGRHNYEIEFQPDGKVSAGMIAEKKGLIIGKKTYNTLFPIHARFNSAGDIVTITVSNHSLHFDDNGVSRDISAPKSTMIFSDLPVDNIGGDSNVLKVRLTRDFTIERLGKQMVLKKDSDLLMNSRCDIAGATIKDDIEVMVAGNTYRLKGGSQLFFLYEKLSAATLAQNTDISVFSKKLNVRAGDSVSFYESGIPRYFYVGKKYTEVFDGKKVQLEPGYYIEIDEKDKDITITKQIKRTQKLIYRGKI